MIDAITSEAVLRMFIDGLSVDEILVAIPTLERADIERVQRGATTLAPAIQTSLEAAGRYVFAPLPFFAPGSRVRLSGDGPSSWTNWIVVARTAAQVRWGTLPGGYVSGPGWNDKEHMGGKPTALMDRLVADYSRRGQLVLDPFMRSGTTGVSCMKTGRRFVGVEIDPAHFETACKRIENAQRQERLFWTYILDIVASSWQDSCRQAGSTKPLYVAAFRAFRFAFLGWAGAGGVASIWRTTSRNFGSASCFGFAASVMA